MWTYSVNEEAGLESLKSLSKAKQLVTVGADFNPRLSHFRDVSQYALFHYTVSFTFTSKKEGKGRREENRRKRGREGKIKRGKKEGRKERELTQVYLKF